MNLNQQLQNVYDCPPYMATYESMQRINIAQLRQGILLHKLCHHFKGFLKLGKVINESHGQVIR